jgi:hypothetical protein
MVTHNGSNRHGGEGGGEQQSPPKAARFWSFTGDAGTALPNTRGILSLLVQVTVDGYAPPRAQPRLPAPTVPDSAPLTVIVVEEPGWT